MMILALDLGTETGWARAAPTTPVQSGWVALKPNRFEGGGMRFVRFQRLLEELVQEDTRIYFEEVRRQIGTDAAHIYGGLVATLSAWCEKNSTPYAPVPVGTWKKHLGLAGNASKAAVMQRICGLGHLPMIQDEADAIGILRFAASQNGLQLEKNADGFFYCTRG